MTPLAIHGFFSITSTHTLQAKHHFLRNNQPIQTSYTNIKMCQVHYPVYLGCGCTFDRAPPPPVRYTRCEGAIQRGETARNCTSPGLSRGENFEVKGNCPQCKDDKDPYAGDHKNTRRRGSGGGKGGTRRSGRRSSRVVR